MTPNDKPQFAALLSRTFKTLGKPAPEVEVLDVWWAKLEPFPIEAVAHAFSRHLDVSEFAPTPAAILKHLPKQRDGHPEPNDAWAIALRSRDERDTVVWTPECAEAFGAARSILEIGDEVGARMAFIERYRQLIEDARASARPARWFASLGHDPARREAALEAAVRDGLLQLEAVLSVAPQLCAPESDVPAADAKANLALIGQMVASIPSAIERHAQERAAATQVDRELTDAAKRAAAQRVSDYEARP